MKKLAVLSGIIILFNTIYAQEEIKTAFLKKANTAILEEVKLDFAVPDIPAFKALGIDPSNILRPSAPRDFGLVFSSFRGTSLIPKNVAVEVAPALFIYPWYTLDEYRSRKGLRLVNKTRISIGTNEDDETGINSVSAGLRTTVFDKGDFRLDGSFQEQHIYAPMQVIQELITLKRREVILSVGGIEVYAALPEERRQAIFDSLFSVSQTEAGFSLDQVINNAIEVYKKTNWNASRLDFAYSLLLQSPDSLISKIKLNKHLFWTTLAIKPGKNNTWAQILLGFNNSVYKVDAAWYNEFTGNFRFYGGTNKFKGLFELQYQNISHPLNDRIETLFTQLGVEVNLLKGAWLHFSTGILNALEGNNTSALRSNLNIYLTFPENFNPLK